MISISLRSKRILYSLSVLITFVNKFNNTNNIHSKVKHSKNPRHSSSYPSNVAKDRYDQGKSSVVQTTSSVPSVVKPKYYKDPANAVLLITEDTAKAIKRYDQKAKIAYSKPIPAKAVPRKTRWMKIKAKWESIQSDMPIIRSALIVVATVAIIGGAIWGWRKYKYRPYIVDNDINKLWPLLKNQSDNDIKLDIKNNIVKELKNVSLELTLINYHITNTTGINDSAMDRQIKEIINYINKSVEYEKDPQAAKIKVGSRIQQIGFSIDNKRYDAFDFSNNYYGEANIHYAKTPDVINSLQKMMSILLKLYLSLHEYDSSHISLNMLPSLSQVYSAYKKTPYNTARNLTYNIAESIRYGDINKFSGTVIDDTIIKAIENTNMDISEKMRIIKQFSYLKILNAIGPIIGKNLDKYLTPLKNDTNNVERNRIIEKMWQRTLQVLLNTPAK